MLATVLNSRFSSGAGSTRNRTFAPGLTTWKTRTIGNGPVLPPKTRHFKFTILTPMKYLSSDHIMTWSICRVCSISRFITSHCQMCNRINICRVAIENPQISHIIWRYFSAIQQILVRLQIWKREVEELLTLHDLYIDHVTIRSELKYLIGSKVAGTIRWNRSPVPNWPKPQGVMSGPAYNMALVTQSTSLAVCHLDWGLWFSLNPDRTQVTRIWC